VAIIDDDGNLLGLINLVDALVVFIVLAVVIAGVAFVLTGASDPAPDTMTRYATLNLGAQPTYIATLVTEGDETDVNPDYPESLRITEVYATETDDDRLLYARVQITGEMDDKGRFQYDGEPLRVGRELDLMTSDYATDGIITAVDDTGSGLPITDTDVLLRTNLSADTVDTIRTGDEYRIDGRTVATVQSVTAYRNGTPGQVRAYVGVTYHTYRASDEPRFAGTSVREGASLPLETNAYAFDGDVVRIGATEPRGQESIRTVRLEIENADPALGDALRTGMTERVRGKAIAELTNVTVQPSTMVLTSQDGDVYRREHPVEEDVSLTADLQVRETNAGVQFKGAPLRYGRTVTLDFGTVTVEATVVNVE
jgi:hypothetical protein